MLISLIASAAFAQSIGVNGEPCDYTDLETAVADAKGGTVYLDVSVSHSIEADITESVTITSGENDCEDESTARAEVVQAGSSSVMTISGAKVTLKNLAFNGSPTVAAGGHVLATDATVSIEGGVLSSGGGLNGGSVRVERSELYITDTTFEGNGGNTGGAVSIGENSTGYIADSTFENNGTSLFGGGHLAVEGSEVDVFRTTFLGGWAARDGGAVVVSNGATVAFVDTTFDGNRSDHFFGGGGALSATDSVVTFADSTFVGNRAPNGAGGAVRVDTGSTVSLVGNTLSGNDANRGGAVVVEGGEFKVDGDVFEDNVATLDGGAVAVDAGTFSIIAPQMTDNVAGRDGGGVFTAQDTSGNITTGTCVSGSLDEEMYCTAFTSNDAEAGGALAIGGALTLVRGHFRANNATNGAAIFVDETGAVVMNNSLLIYNGLTTTDASIRVAGTLKAAHVTIDAPLTAPAQFDTAVGSYFRRSIATGLDDFLVSAGTLSATCSNIDGVNGSLSGGNRLSEDPVYAWVTGRGPFRLDASSPSRNACGWGFGPDLDGASRPSGGAYDMGAFEQ